MTEYGPAFFLVDEIEWPDEEPASAPRELVEEAKRLGARRKFLGAGKAGTGRRCRSSPPGTRSRCTATTITS